MDTKNFFRSISAKNKNLREIYTFILNGLFATFVHFFFLILFVNFTFLNYGASNLLSFILGSLTSFLGNKFFVFKIQEKGKTYIQLAKFSALYLALAFNHGIALYIWSDINNYNYIVGFLLITILNTSISFLFNKYMIFNAK